MTQLSLCEGSQHGAFLTDCRCCAEGTQAPLPDMKSIPNGLAVKSGVCENIAFDIESLPARLLDADHELLEDVEILEMIMSIAGASRSPRLAAESLLERFECFGCVVHASSDKLASTDGVGRFGAALLKLVNVAALRMLKPEASAAPIFACWDQLINYLKASLTFAEVEQCFTLYLDAQNRLIANESLGCGTVRHAPFYPREIIRRALALNACALILVHNHPSGNTTPSREDIVLTRELIEAGALLEIAVHDHLIIGRGGYASFRELKLI